MQGMSACVYVCTLWSLPRIVLHKFSLLRESLPTIGSTSLGMHLMGLPPIISQSLSLSVSLIRLPLSPPTLNSRTLPLVSHSLSLLHSSLPLLLPSPPLSLSLPLRILQPVRRLRDFRYTRLTSLSLCPSFLSWDTLSWCVQWLCSAGNCSLFSARQNTGDDSGSKIKYVMVYMYACTCDICVFMYTYQYMWREYCWFIVVVLWLLGGFSVTSYWFLL